MLKGVKTPKRGVSEKKIDLHMTSQKKREEKQEHSYGFHRKESEGGDICSDFC